MEELKVDWKVVQDKDYYLSKEEYKKKVLNPEYYQANKERIRQKYKEERGKRLLTQREYDQRTREQKHEYYLRNKARIQERNKAYYREHKEKFREYERQRTVRQKMDKVTQKAVHGSKPKIMFLIGESGVGKTEASLFLKDVYGDDCNLMVSYTTRPMRDGEVDGRDHWFVSKDKVPDKKDMLAYTVFGDHEYWALKSDVKPTGVTVYVIDEKGFKWFKDKYSKDYQLFPIHIIRDIDKRTGVDKERIARDTNRNSFIGFRYFRVIENNGGIGEFHHYIRKYFEVIRNY